MEDIEKGEYKKTPIAKTHSVANGTGQLNPQNESKFNQTYFSRYNLFKNPLNAGKTMGLMAGGGVAAWYMVPALVGAALGGFIPALGYGAGFFALGYGGKVLAEEYEKYKATKPGP